MKPTEIYDISLEEIDTRTVQLQESLRDMVGTLYSSICRDRIEELRRERLRRISGLDKPFIGMGI